MLCHCCNAIWYYNIILQELTSKHKRTIISSFHHHGTPPKISRLLHHKHWVNPIGRVSCLRNCFHRLNRIVTAQFNNYSINPLRAACPGWSLAGRNSRNRRECLGSRPSPATSWWQLMMILLRRRMMRRLLLVSLARCCCWNTLLYFDTKRATGHPTPTSGLEVVECVTK